MVQDIAEIVVPGLINSLNPSEKADFSEPFAGNTGRVDGLMQSR